MRFFLLRSVHPRNDVGHSDHFSKIKINKILSTGRPANIKKCVFRGGRIGVTKAKWDLFKMIRQMTLNEMANVTEIDVDRIPNGFNNNIRWNLGHIYNAAGGLLTRFTGESTSIPAHYPKLFDRGTKPADWQGDVPSLVELRKCLEEQVEELEFSYEKRLNDALITPCDLGMVQLTTIGELLDFICFHEGLHVGTIKGLKRTLGL